jgi:hypothetical protein
MKILAKIIGILVITSCTSQSNLIQSESVRPVAVQPNSAKFIYTESISLDDSTPMNFEDFHMLYLYREYITKRSC